MFKMKKQITIPLFILIIIIASMVVSGTLNRMRAVDFLHVTSLGMILGGLLRSLFPMINSK